MKMTPRKTDLFPKMSQGRNALLCGCLLFLQVQAAQGTEMSLHEIVVTDCEGITRAQIQNIDGSIPHALNVTLEQGTVMPEKVKLTSTSQNLERQVVSGQAAFTDIHPGVYELCDDGKLAKISRIAIEPQSELSTSTVGGIAAGVAAIGGSAIALNGGGSSDSANTGQNTLSESNSAPSTTKELAKPATQAASKPSTFERDCLNGAKVNPISPFD